jgi:hypothetical protein
MIGTILSFPVYIDGDSLLTVLGRGSGKGGGVL